MNTEQSEKHKLNARSSLPDKNAGNIFKKCRQKFAYSKIIRTFASLLKGNTSEESFGEVAEWSIAAVLKTVVPRGTRGSNPCLSATEIMNIYNEKGCRFARQPFLL